MGQARFRGQLLAVTLSTSRRTPEYGRPREDKERLVATSFELGVTASEVAPAQRVFTSASWTPRIAGARRLDVRFQRNHGAVMTMLDFDGR